MVSQILKSIGFDEGAGETASITNFISPAIQVEGHRLERIYCSGTKARGPYYLAATTSNYVNHVMSHGWRSFSPPLSNTRVFWLTPSHGSGDPTSIMRVLKFRTPDAAETPRSARIPGTYRIHIKSFEPNFLGESPRIRLLECVHGRREVETASRRC